MVILIALFLVFFGFFSVFYSSAIDLFSTYLPERLIYSMFPIGYLGWGLFSFLTHDSSLFLKSVTTSIISFVIGYVLFRLQQWASGDMWLLSGIFAVLSPAFENFSSKFPFYLLIMISCWSLLSYLYLLAVNGELLKVSLLFAISALILIGTPFQYALLFTVLAFSGFFILTYKKVKEILNGTKEIRELEEDDWPMGDVDLGFSIVRKNQPVTKYEGFLANLSGKRKKIDVKLGVPLTPAFSLALILLLF